MDGVKALFQQCPDKIGCVILEPERRGVSKQFSA
jgi:hypothetical protein